MSLYFWRPSETAREVIRLLDEDPQRWECLHRGPLLRCFKHQARNLIIESDLGLVHTVVIADGQCWEAARIDRWAINAALDRLHFWRKRQRQERAQRAVIERIRS